MELTLEIWIYIKKGLCFKKRRKEKLQTVHFGFFVKKKFKFNLIHCTENFLRQITLVICINKQIGITFDGYIQKNLMEWKHFFRFFDDINNKFWPIGYTFINFISNKS